MNAVSVQGAISTGIHVIQGEPCWVGAWRDAVQLSAVLESKHIPNTVIMATAFSILQSLYSAEQEVSVMGSCIRIVFGWEWMVWSGLMGMENR